MTPEELQERLKVAGQPVESTLDPVPVIVSRARQVQRRRALTVAVTSVATVTIAAMLNMYGLPDSRVPEPATTTNSTRSPRAPGVYPDIVLENLLPGRLGSLARVDFTKVPERGSADPGKLTAIKQGDQLRVVYMCQQTNGASPINLKVVVFRTGFVPSAGSRPSPQIAASLPNCLDNTPQVVTIQVPDSWPAGDAEVVTDPPAASLGWGRTVRAALYR
jgi:hypothetical protein